MSACQCVRTHSPPAPKTQVHHIVPKSWFGPDTAINKIVVCGTTHDAIHELLNRAVKTREMPTFTSGFGYAAVSLARRGVAEYLARNSGLWPTRLTLHREES